MSCPLQILPQAGGRWITRDLYEEPSGDVRSTLILEDVGVEDNGWYICRDEKDINTYTIWVTTLQGKYHLTGAVPRQVFNDSYTYLYIFICIINLKYLIFVSLKAFKVFIVEIRLFFSY